MHEVVSNKLEVLECLPESDRATSKSFNIRTDSLPLERALGVVWCIQNDTFQFRINTRNKVRCSFVLGKARVASLKQITPTAAVVLGKMNKILKHESKLVDVKEYFLVDSKIVLGYINDEDFRTFLTEVECIIPLTPNHVLTKKPNLLPPLQDFLRQINTQKSAGGGCSFYPINFGSDGERNIFTCCNRVLSGSPGKRTFDS